MLRHYAGNQKRFKLKSIECGNENKHIFSVFSSTALNLFLLVLFTHGTKTKQHFKNQSMVIAFYDQSSVYTSVAKGNKEHQRQLMENIVRFYLVTPKPIVRLQVSRSSDQPESRRLFGLQFISFCFHIWYGGLT